ncbi:MAG TPA: phosphotransferase [Terriglobales bacterium]|nr:phosphotransferase [Terriglobales bacterium]
MAPADRIAAWLPQQRWYGAKGVAIAGAGCRDRVALGGNAELWLVEVIPASQPPSTYLLPVTGGDDDACLDGLADEDLRRRLFDFFRQGAVLTGDHGTFRFEPLLPLPEAPHSRLLGAEQSNTSVLYHDADQNPRWLLKLFRRVLVGENPEFEVPRALVRTSFRNFPPAAGRLIYRSAREQCTLAALQTFIPNQGDGWQFVLAELRAGRGEPLLAEVALLGRRTAELHAALASLQEEAAFAPEPVTPAALESWRQRALAFLADPILASDAALLAPWRKSLQAGAPALAALAACQRIRIHGDYHLGQVLKSANDFYIFDFEGEPVRPLAERRQKSCALQDVAGMLRSFSYAAATAALPDWDVAASAAFLNTYRATVPAALVPQGEAAFAAALRFFTCEKAVYELAYELHHRPAWAHIPRAALRSLTPNP